MPRVKRSVAAHKKRRKVLEQAKGYWGRKSTHYRYGQTQDAESKAPARTDDVRAGWSVPLSPLPVVGGGEQPMLRRVEYDGRDSVVNG